MKEQFDKRLVEKIKDSFENYEEPFDPKEWEKFSDVYFKKDKTKPTWMWMSLISGIAASLIIGFMIWPKLWDSSYEDNLSHDWELTKPKKEGIIAIDPKQERKIPEGSAKSPSINRTMSKDQESFPIDSQEQDHLDVNSPVMSQILLRKSARISKIAVNVPTLSKLDHLPFKKLEIEEVLERDLLDSNNSKIFTPPVFSLPSTGIALRDLDPLPSKNLNIDEILSREMPNAAGDRVVVIPPAWVIPTEKQRLGELEALPEKRLALSDIIDSKKQLAASDRTAITSPRWLIPTEKLKLGDLQPLPPKKLGITEIKNREGQHAANDQIAELAPAWVITFEKQILGESETLPQKNLAIEDYVNRREEVVMNNHSKGSILNSGVTKDSLKEEDAQKIVNKWAMAETPSIMAKKDSDTGVKWGVVMAPQSASNSTMGLNLGGGLMSEISLSRRLKIDVGVTFAQQRLVPMEGQEVALIMNNNSRNAPENQLQQSEGFNQIGPAAIYGVNVVSPIIPTYELNFANLDIPINLKYKLLDRSQSGLYLISGLSSMIYLNQSTTETYNISSVGIGNGIDFSQNTVQSFTTEVIPHDGSRVDLGRMLNLSVGYEYKLTNGTFLSLEPFYKLPIGNMTFVNQQFSIGGINLRMNFQFKK